MRMEVPQVAAQWRFLERWLVVLAGNLTLETRFDLKHRCVLESITLAAPEASALALLHLREALELLQLALCVDPLSWPYLLEDQCYVVDIDWRQLHRERRKFPCCRIRCASVEVLERAWMVRREALSAAYRQARKQVLLLHAMNEATLKEQCGVTWLQATLRLDLGRVCCDDAARKEFGRLLKSVQITQRMEDATMGDQEDDAGLEGLPRLDLLDVEVRDVLFSDARMKQLATLRVKGVTITRVDLRLMKAQAPMAWCRHEQNALGLLVAARPEKVVVYSDVQEVGDVMTAAFHAEGVGACVEVKSMINRDIMSKRRIKQRNGMKTSIRSSKARLRNVKRKTRQNGGILSPEMQQLVDRLEALEDKIDAMEIMAPTLSAINEKINGAFIGAIVAIITMALWNRYRSVLYE